jgi:hypothetical protein
MEREADAFAASLLLPTHLVKTAVNAASLTLKRLDDLSNTYETSIVCTTFRAVRLSRYPCAVAGIREGAIAWLFPSESLIELGCFPGKKKLESTSAREQWRAFQAGGEERSGGEATVSDWFQLYDDSTNMEAVFVREEFIPVHIMKTLLVLLTIDEDDLPEELEEEDEDDKLHRERFRF